MLDTTDLGERIFDRILNVVEHCTTSKSTCLNLQLLQRATLNPAADKSFEEISVQLIHDQL